MCGWRRMQNPVSLTDRSFYYDIIYDALNVLFLQFNPCRIDKKGKCVRSREHLRDKVPGYQCYIHLAACCCHRDCKYLTTVGCSTRSLGCKFYICYAIAERYPEFAKEVNRITKFIDKFDLPWNVYSSKEETFAGINNWLI